MDFLTLMIIYAVCFFSSALLVFGGSKNSNIAIIRWIFVHGEQVSSYVWYSVIPAAVRQKLDNVSNRFLYQRNPVFQIIYFLLWLTIFLQYSFQVDPLLRRFKVASAVRVLAYAGFFINLVIFLCCSWANPGIITKANSQKFATVYRYDDWMFRKGIRCPSCDVLKPARSKHCAICNHCVHRFDHHCTWVNNCIGAGNVGYFLLFLMTLTVQCALIAALSTVALWKVAEATGLLNAQYLDANKVRRPVTIFIIVQDLFMRRPFVVFITTALWLLMVLTGGFTFYHLFLACTNQTTNERYKLAALYRSDQKGSLKNGGKNAKHLRPAWFYTNGPWANLKEVVFGIR